MPKNVVLCFDGTRNEFGAKNTNVVKLFRNLECDAHNQIAFYDPGVGTFNPFRPGVKRWLWHKPGALLGSMFGWGLEDNLQDGYRYLMNYYEEGDILYLFGFSRGAFTARALAGMLYYFGLLEKGSENLIPYVSKYYVEEKFDKAGGFKETFCRPCNPYFIGVWDTVRSLDYLGFKKFYDAELKENVKHGYQAVSVDEKRSKFEVSLWDESKLKSGQVIEQVWFPGVHSDVGGGYAETALSDIALGWMLDKAEACDLILKPDWKSNVNPDPAGTLHTSYKWHWKLLGKSTRSIPEGSLIHQSVPDRMEKIFSYHPTLPEERTIVNNDVYHTTQLD